MKVPPSRPRDKRNSKHKPKRFDKSIISDLPWEIKEDFHNDDERSGIFPMRIYDSA